MANAEKIRETLDVIRKNLPRWKQEMWSSGKVNPNAKDWTECKTAFCFAGWAAVLNGWRPVANEYGYAIDSLFEKYGNKLTAGIIASTTLDLNYSESQALFDGDIPDFKTLEARAENVIAGAYPEPY